MGIEKISFKDSCHLKEKFAEGNFFIAEIDGKPIKNLEDYMRKIIEVFKFPEGLFKNLDNFDSYDDWMTDLSWLYERKWIDKDNVGFVLFLYNFDKMMEDEPDRKKKIVYYFNESIIPFWKDEVENVIVGGKSRVFEVFIVK